MTFQELLQKYPYLNDCRVNKTLPKVICKYRAYDGNNSLKATWEAPMSVDSVLLHPYLQKNMGCGCTNEYDVTNHINNIINGGVGEMEMPEASSMNIRVTVEFVGWED